MFDTSTTIKMSTEIPGVRIRIEVELTNPLDRTDEEVLDAVNEEMTDAMRELQTAIEEIRE